MEKTACLLEYPEQLIQSKISSAADNYEFYGATHDVLAWAQRAGLTIHNFTEDILISEWDAINAWARKVSLQWFESEPFKSLLTFHGVNLGDVLYRPVSHGLIYYLKNYLLAERFLEKTKGLKIAVFHDQKDDRLQNSKEILGSANYLLRLHQARRNMTHSQTLACHFPYKNESTWKDIVRILIQDGRKLVLRPGGRMQYAGMGALNHISPILRDLAGSAKVDFIDESFQMGPFRQCRERGIGYWIWDEFLSRADKNQIRNSADHLKSALSDIVIGLEDSPENFYQGKKIEGMSAVINEIFSERIEDRLKYVAVCEKLFASFACEKIVLHEDIGVYRAAARAASEAGKPVFMISHGMPPAISDWSGLANHVGIGETIVNSEFEKDRYVRTGYLEERIRVLGLPRFDSIYSRVQISVKKNSASRIVLYCPHMLRELAKYKIGYMGIHTPGALTRKYAVTVLEACRKLGYELWIKLHDNQDQESWKQLVREHGDASTKLFEHHENIFDLIERSDLVVTTFSTVVIEAMLFDRNVISMNFTSRADVHPYAEKGISLPVTQAGDLERAIQDCFENQKTIESLRLGRQKCKKYFGGEFDGKNTQRAVQFIQNYENGILSEKPAAKTVSV